MTSTSPSPRAARSVCVFCGSAQSIPAQYIALAKHTGELLAECDLRVVYGGASVGMMGALADGALAKNGDVLGVIPESLKAREIAHQGLTELVTSASMGSRKALMFAESTAFVTLPGGFGTLDELYEIVTERQIGLHKKRIVVLNMDGYFDPQREWLARAVREQFISSEVAAVIEWVSDLSSLKHWLTEVFAAQ